MNSQVKKPVYIIAEAGVNHNGSVELAKELIDLAAASGADAVKFQTFKANRIISKFAPKADYQKACDQEAQYQSKSTDAKESQLEMVKKLELDEKSHEVLISHCMKREIEFLSTPFDFESIDLLTQKLNINKLKLPSGELNNAPFLLKAAQTHKPIILSTGMSNLGEIETALAVIAFGYLGKKDKPTRKSFQEAYSSLEGQKVLQEKVTLLHCTTEYPAPDEEINLKALKTLKQAFGLAVGFSDHSKGIAVPIASVALGACVIEKHFTLSRQLPGPDHKASLEGAELKAMIDSIRQVEKALGSNLKLPTVSEVRNKTIARKSLVAACNIKAGEVFSESNLAIKRPGNGIEPIHFWEFMGQPANQDYEEDELIKA